MTRIHDPGISTIPWFASKIRTRPGMTGSFASDDANLTEP